MPKVTSSRQINLAIIGCGKWGINHVRTARRLMGSGLKSVYDPDPKAIHLVKSISEEIAHASDLEEILNDPKINAVIIATPPSTHYSIAKRCLNHGKNVLVEKPLTLHLNDARMLVRIARENDKKLMVGHVLLYHPAIVELKHEIEKGRIGKIRYIYSNRLNLGTIRNEENILWSFAPHDISIIQHLIKNQPIYVDGKGAHFLQNNMEDTTLTYLVYPNNIHAHIFVSWLHPFKEHRLIVIGEKGMLVFEDNLQEEKLKFFPNGYNEDNGRLHKFEGDYEVVNFDSSEPLENEHRHFIDCITNDKRPITDGLHAVEVLDILEKAQSQLKESVSDQTSSRSSHSYRHIQSVYGPSALKRG